MEPEQLNQQAQKEMESAVERFSQEAKKIRTGRAQPSILEGIMVEVYGTSMPLNQVGNITAPEGQLLQITPFDPNNLQAITAAIRDNKSLGLNPMDDGRVVRVPIPALTEERRKQIVKILHEKVEECLIRLRQIRHETLKKAEQAKKDKSLSEDQYTRVHKSVDQAVADSKTKIESLSQAKETEIMTV